jgi:putative PIN family toxin of toxin-antitoxin system
VRLVLDTNVIISGVAADGLCRRLVRRRVKAHDLFTCSSLLDELAGILKSKFKCDPEAVPLFVAYRRRAKQVDPTPAVIGIVRDPDDDVVLATAVAAKVDVIVTGDADLLILKKYKGIRILSPRQFLELLDTGT